MWFKNLQLHRLPAPWAVTPDQLEKWLAPHAFQPGNSVEKQSFGWASPRDDGALVYSIMRLAMTWDDRISFVLTPSLTIKRVTPLDVIKEAENPTAQNDDERFDSDVALMTGELGRMLTDLVEILGGDQHDSMHQAAAA
ncbi:recombination-associated protein RdgC [Ralstonia solanacearum]|uniref:recombination-associated protein RdgC n=1 Tax=Ralstonia solanacearum TaxID=305 RepID=UPI00234A9195|nr:recombination-associated protein RdgC [Ralstonia solanacearum]MDC6301966.1 recombination-associated protein RdgC [Ralstonia solanacearum]